MPIPKPVTGKENRIGIWLISNQESFHGLKQGRLITEKKNWHSVGKGKWLLVWELTVVQCLNKIACQISLEHSLQGHTCKLSH